MKWQKKAARTQTIRLVLGLLVGAILIFLPQGRAQARLRLNAKAVMRLPVSEMILQKAQVITIVQKLESQFNAPVSFIQAVQDNPTSINVVDGTAHDVLDQILHQNPMYRVRQLKGRLILMPTGTQFDTKIGGIAIKNVPREQATQNYLAILSKQKGFDAIEGLAMAGSWTTIYTTPVTLARKAGVIEHFVELLGNDKLLYFSLHKGAHENLGYLFWYGNVKERPHAQDQLSHQALPAASLPLTN